MQGTSFKTSLNRVTLKGGSVVGPTAQQAPRCTAPRRTAPHRAASRRRESFIIIIRRFANWFIRLNGDNDRPAGFTVGQLYRLFIIGCPFSPLRPEISVDSVSGTRKRIGSPIGSLPMRSRIMPRIKGGIKSFPRVTMNPVIPQSGEIAPSYSLKFRENLRESINHLFNLIRIIRIDIAHYFLYKVKILRTREFIVWYKMTYDI